MSYTPVGGRKHRAWRLKKKWDKYFSKIVGTIIRDTLKNLPKGLFEEGFSNEEYQIVRLYK